jgi:hypothetical protein
MRRISATAVALALVLGACSSGDDDDHEDTERRVDIARTLLSYDRLVGTLEDERNVSSVALTGLTAATGYLPDLSDMRSDTDSRLDRLTRVDTADVLPAAAATAATLEALRDDVDAALPGASLQESDAARKLVDRYTAVIDQYLDAGDTALAKGVDDPGLRDGVTLVVLVDRLQENEAQLVQLIVRATIAGGSPSSGDLTAVGRLMGEQRIAVEKLRASKREPYRGIIESAFPEDHYDAMVGFAEGMAKGEPVNLVELIDAATAGGASYGELQEQLLEALGGSSS